VKPEGTNLGHELLELTRISNREPRQTRERELKYAEGVKEISLGLEQHDYPGKTTKKLFPP
jgi:hypothetical protein